VLHFGLETADRRMSFLHRKSECCPRRPSNPFCRCRLRTYQWQPLRVIGAPCERAELVSVCDNRPEALAAAVARTGARGFASLTELLAASDADIVTLATPSGLHPQQASKSRRPAVMC